MTDEEIVEALRAEARNRTPAEIALLFDELSGGQLSQFSLITCFRQAFPKIPLRVLIGLGKWKRVGGLRWSDDDVNHALREWFPYNDDV